MKLSSPAAERNVGPLGDVMARFLPERGVVLEIASGGGLHAVELRRRFPHLEWHPADPDPDARASIDTRRAEAGLANLRASRALDAAATDWGIASVDLILCVNMLHIAPWSAAEGLFRGAGRVLTAGGRLITYGPYRIDGTLRPESNVAFDRSLRTRNPAWGIRDIDELTREAEANGLARTDLVPMPANNHVIVYTRASPAAGARS